jgi:osmotically inducible lipoprotein OsmB
MHNKANIFAALLTLAMVSACGNTTSDRALSGGGIGAGVGAVGSTMTGGDPLTGALIGGGVGAATGALTDESDINLGRPIWRKQRR